MAWSRCAGFEDRDDCPVLYREQDGSVSATALGALYIGIYGIPEQDDPIWQARHGHIAAGSYQHVVERIIKGVKNGHRVSHSRRELCMTYAGLKASGKAKAIYVPFWEYMEIFHIQGSRDYLSVMDELDRKLNP